ncbi:NUDIX domain-containing protein [Xylariales sp. PMI_506]|nr:NUDIX domain-containing protein [Xylariales sp. PMI_506]
MPPLSNLDIVSAVDNFPYDLAKVAEVLPDPLYTLLHRTDDGDLTLGYMLEPFVRALEALPESIRGPVSVDDGARTIRAFDLPTEPERSAAVARVMKHWHENATFEIIRKWRDELWPVYDARGNLLYNVERAGAGLLGVMRYGVHMSAYVRDASAPHGIKLWIPRRSKTKSNYPSMLDNTVAGGLMTGEDPLECVIREADEEANLPESLMRERCKVAGTVVLIHVTDERAGGEKGMIYPETQWVYDLELPADVKPTPKDGEVEEFYLWTVEETQAALARGEFKPNCGLILLDFFVRRGIVTRENEPQFEEMVRKMHRAVPFPGPHRTAAPSATLSNI